MNEFGTPDQPLVLAVNVVPRAPEVGETDTLPPDGATRVSDHIAYNVTSEVNVILFPGA